MTSLLAKFRASIDSDKREVARKVAANRDPEVRSVLAILNRVAKEGVSLSCWWGEPVVSFDVSDLDSFKVGPLPKMLTKLINLGVEFHRSADYAEGGSREFCGKLGKVEVRVTGYLSSTAKQCQKIEVGEEIRVVKKYELCCN